MKLSLAAYSFNKILLRRPDEAQLRDAAMRLEDFIEYCALLNLDGCELTSYYFPKEFSHDYLMKIKEMTFRLGLDISGTAIGNDFCVSLGAKRDRELAQTREWIDHAATMGAPVIRIFAGRQTDGMSREDALSLCVQGIDDSLDYAATRGVLLALENHGGITSTVGELLEIVKRVKPSPWFGVNLDSGNFGSEDPYAELEQIAPYTVNAQIKVAVKRNGRKEPTDFARVVSILKNAGYRGYVVLEYEEEDDPKQAIPGFISELRKLIRA
jgi:sugar phosphate isomerase/epimerase